MTSTLLSSVSSASMMGSIFMQISIDEMYNLCVILFIYAVVSCWSSYQPKSQTLSNIFHFIRI